MTVWIVTDEPLDSDECRTVLGVYDAEHLAYDWCNAQGAELVADISCQFTPWRAVWVGNRLEVGPRTANGCYPHRTYAVTLWEVQS